MLFMVVLTVVAVLVAIGAVQNGQVVTVSFFFWQFQSPLALVILAAAAGGSAIGLLVAWTRALQRWRHRPVRPGAPTDASAPDRFSPSHAPIRTPAQR